MTRANFRPMPRRHPLPLPVPPPLLARLDALRLSGGDAARLERELEDEGTLVHEFAALRALGARASGARELCDLARAAALLAELRRTCDAHAAGRAAAQALLVARLGACIARRSPRPLTLPDSELFCLPLALAVARARIDPSLSAPAAAAHDAARLAHAWGLSAAAVELLADSSRPAREGRDEAHLLELARRLACEADAPRGDLRQAALERPASALGLRPAELAELADFAASARATTAA